MVMDMRKDKWKRVFKQRQIVLAALVMVLAAVGMTGVYVSEKSAPKEEQFELKEESDTEQIMVSETDEEGQKAEEEPAEDVSNVLIPEVTVCEPVEPEIETDKPTEEAEESTMQPEEQAVSTGTTSANLSFSENSDLLWPLKGNVIMNYSMDQTIYHATLDQYRYNPAVVIAGNVNDKVSCAATGIITDISNNEETGCTVSMDLGNGYTAVYGQLKEVPFHAGAYVEAGDVIGYVSEPTKYYSVEGSNLYFELMKDGAPVNPISFFAAE